MTTPVGYLHSFHPVSFGTAVPQTNGLRWLMRALLKARDEITIDRSDRALQLYEQFLGSGIIDQRLTCVEDYTHEDWSSMRLYRNTDASPWYRPTLPARMTVFREQAIKIVDKAYPKGSAPPGYLIQVSCTGYDSPHAVQRLVSQRGWHDETKILHLGHMGCYAAIPAAQMAARLLHSPELETSRASVMLVELCTLHLDPCATDTEAVVLNTLFADGAIRFDISRNRTRRCLAAYNHLETILPDSEEEMTWVPGQSAFAMTLSRAVPVLLARQIHGCLKRLLAPSGLRLDDIAAFAIHPGGPKILDLIGDTLQLSADQLTHSRHILRTRGNMSSCTLPHVWNEILEDPEIADGSWIVSAAFGPGLTLAASLLRKEAAT